MIRTPTWILFSLTLMMGIGWNATLPFVGVYLAVSRSAPLWVIGVSYFATGVASLGSQVLGGRLTDRYGPRNVMLLGYSASIVSAILLGRLITDQADALLIAGFYPASALTRGLCQPVPAAIIASSRQSDMMTRFSFLTVASNLGFAVGPAIGGILAQQYGYPTIFFFTATVFGATALTALVSIGGGRLYDGAGLQEKRARRLLNPKRDKNVIILLVLAFSSFLVSGFDIQPLSLYSATFLHIPNDQIGYLFSTNGLGVVLLQFPLIRLVKRSRRALLPLISANLVCVVGFVMAASAASFLELEGVMVVLTLSEMLLAVPMQTIMATLSEPETRGTYQGISSGVMNAGRSMAAFVGPTMFSLLIFEPSLAWYAISGVAILVAVCLILFSPTIQREYDRASLR